MIILKTRSEIPKIVCDTWPAQNASAHQTWNSYFKDYDSYAPDLMPILETRSEVKVTMIKNETGPPFQDAFSHQRDSYLK